MIKNNYFFVFVNQGFDEKHRGVNTRGIHSLERLNGIQTASGFNSIIVQLSKNGLIWKKS